MVTSPTFIRLLVQIASSFDWFTNPWHEEGLEMATWTGPYELRKLQVSWNRTPSVGVAQDPDMCTFHFLNLTGGDPDDTWTDTDFTTVESAFDAFWGFIKSIYATDIRLSEYAWRADGPDFKPHGDSFSPTLRVITRSVPGTVSPPKSLPPQCAMTVTEVTESHYTAFGVGVPGSTPGTGRTQVRNRWGRFYLPAIDSSFITAGRIQASVCSDVSGAVKTFYNSCVASDIIPVMYSPTTGSSWSVNAVHVDDIVDVIRSRRWVTPVTRAPNTIDAP